MLATLETVFGAVSTKDVVPILTHVLIYKGRMQGGDGTIAIDAPFDCAIEPCAVPGQKFLNAAKACKGAPKLTITPGGKLSIKQGSFRALLSTLPADSFPVDAPRGEDIPVPVDLLSVLKKLRPFISQDASRPWSTGLLLSSGFAYATNNVILARVPLAWYGPKIVLPVSAVDALIDLRELPSTMWVEEGSSVSFKYNDTSWLKTQLKNGDWPDVAKMLHGLPTPSEKIPDGLLDAVQRVKKFCTNLKFPVIRLSPEGVSSDDGGGDLATIDDFSVAEGFYNGDMLELMLLSATHADFTLYPKPCTFIGDGGLAGLFVGVQQ